MGLRIVGVDILPVEVPRHGGFSLHRGDTPPTSPYTVVRIRTNEGVTGYGEGSTTVRSIHRVASDHLAEILIGQDPFNLNAIHARLDATEMMCVERLGHWNCIRCAVDVALHDIMGKWLDVPLHKLYGGRRRERVPVVKNVSVGEPQVAAEQAAELAEAGYRAIKMRVGTDPRVDVARVQAVRDVLGAEGRIYLDANQAWTAKNAVAIISRLRQWDIEAVEQPCAFWDLSAAATVVAGTDVPIVADEGLWTLADAQLLLSARAADVLCIYLGKCGGLTQALKIAAVAEAFGAGLVISERIPLGISEAAHCHLAAVVPNLPFACGLGYDLNEHDLLATPLDREGDCFVVPDGPGLGVSVDEDRLEFYARR